MARLELFSQRCPLSVPTLQTLAPLAGIFFIAGYIPYILSALRGKTKPKLVTWIIWGGIDALTAYSMWVAGTWTWAIMGAAGGAVIMMIIAARNSEATALSIYDKLALACAMVALVFIFLLDLPVMSIIATQIAIAVGAIPTIKEYQDENPLAWGLFWIGGVIGVITIPEYSWGDALQPWNFFLIQSAILGLLAYNRNKE